MRLGVFLFPLNIKYKNNYKSLNIKFLKITSGAYFLEGSTILAKAKVTSQSFYNYKYYYYNF